MSERTAESFLTALRRAAAATRLYGPDHPLSGESANEAAEAARRLLGGRDETSLVVAEDSLFVDGSVLPRTSLEFNGLLRQMEACRVGTITVTHRVGAGDMTALVAILAGLKDEYTGGSGLSVNETITGDVPVTSSSRMRRSYSTSLDTLRDIGLTLRSGKRLDLQATTATVAGLLDRALSDPSAALLLSTVKSHHEYTFYHSINTCILSLSLGRAVGLDEGTLMLLGTGALLHDIGKIGVSESILSHPGRLSPEQWEEIRRHPQVGAEAILAAASPGQEVAAAVAFEHHARIDGSGYPRLVYHDHTHGEAGTGPLHLFSRLVAVADTYDALTTRRSYRRPDPPSRALHVLLEAAGSSYDGDAVSSFIQMMGVFPPGSFLRLRSGHVVMVTESAEPDEALSAVVVRDAAGMPVASPEPVRVPRREVADQVSDSDLGMEPADVLESLESAA